MGELMVILGAGESGVGAALLAKAKGFEVFVSDANSITQGYLKELISSGIDYEEGTHTEDKILQAKEIIKSPGIPDNIELLQKATKAKIKIIGEIEFAARYTNSRKVCITGTNGKTTTTLLTFHILKKAGFNVKLAGNIGNSFARQVLHEINHPENDIIYVLEISSFMLDNMYSFQADIAVLTNITPDHLDRYNHQIEKYIESKFRVIQNMDAKGVFIYGIDSELIENHLLEIDTPAKELPFSIYPDDFDGACGDEESIIIQIDNVETEIDLTKSVLKGKHNVLNIMAATLATMSLGVTKEVIEASLQDFVNHPHRMQTAGVINAITFINDSKATNVDSAWYALDAIKQPLIWIAGGVDKGNDYSKLIDVVKGKVKALVCLGKENQKLIKAFSKIIPVIKQTDNIHECVKLCVELGEPGSVALLSPCCASFDLFKNYEDRGNQFMQEVKKLESTFEPTIQH